MGTIFKALNKMTDSFELEQTVVENQTDNAFEIAYKNRNPLVEADLRPSLDNHEDCLYCGRIRNYSKFIFALVILTVTIGFLYAEGKTTKQNRNQKKEAVQQQTTIENEIVSESVKKIEPLLLLDVFN